MVNREEITEKKRGDISSNGLESWKSRRKEVIALSWVKWPPRAFYLRMELTCSQNPKEV